MKLKVPNPDFDVRQVKIQHTVMSRPECVCIGIHGFDARRLWLALGKERQIEVLEVPTVFDECLVLAVCQEPLTQLLHREGGLWRCAMSR